MFVAVLQNDASLLPCRLDELRDLIRLEHDEGTAALGAGYAQDGHSLVQRRPGTSPVAEDPLSLLEDVQARSAIVSIRRATVGSYRDENTHPFRTGGWLFAHAGTVNRFGDMRPALLEALPDFLARQISGETDSEHVFAVFAAALKASGHLEAHDVPAEALVDAARQTIEQIEAFSASVGGSGSTLNLVATNGRSLVATRRGDIPLYLGVLDGLDTCARCGIDPDTRSTHPQLLPHQRLRAVIVASALTRPDDRFRALDDGELVAVDAGLEPVSAWLDDAGE